VPTLEARVAPGYKIIPYFISLGFKTFVKNFCGLKRIFLKLRVPTLEARVAQS
jgi:hypothetical protein